jgi:hypothetical protein
MSDVVHQPEGRIRLGLLKRIRRPGLFAGIRLGNTRRPGLFVVNVWVGF